jgi:hypothetical protein
MPNVSVLEQIELAELPQSLDDGRVAADAFQLRTLLNPQLTDLQAKEVARGEVAAARGDFEEPCGAVGEWCRGVEEWRGGFEKWCRAAEEW